MAKPVPLASIRNRLGLVHLYTGDGKGKTTAAFGLALRAAGHGLRVLVVQFLKGGKGPFGEAEALRHLENVTVVQFGPGGFTGRDFPFEDGKAIVRQGWEFASNAVRSGDFDLVVLDEVPVAVRKGMLSEKEVVALLRKKAPRTEVVLTGRHAGPALQKAADLVTEMKCVKHPFEQGVRWRWGVER
ncbi:MAG: cob(I)yrinic acid a,c-diamide adenosyltransferase [Halobacteria archaeon]